MIEETITRTTFGTVTRKAGQTTITADGDTLRDWACRGDNSWPCSVLARLETITAAFDSSGDLVGLVGDDDDLAALSSDELNAWTSDVLIRAGYPSHPAIR